MNQGHTSVPFDVHKREKLWETTYDARKMINKEEISQGKFNI